MTRRAKEVPEGKVRQSSTPWNHGKAQETEKPSTQKVKGSLKAGGREQSKSVYRTVESLFSHAHLLDLRQEVCSLHKLN